MSEWPVGCREGDIVVHLPVSTAFARRAPLTCPHARVDVSLLSPGQLILRRPADLADRSVGVLIGSGARLAAIELLPGAGRQVLCPTHACLSEALALTHRFVLARRLISLARSQGRLGALSESLLRLPMPDLQTF